MVCDLCSLNIFDRIRQTRRGVCVCVEGVHSSSVASEMPLFGKRDKDAGKKHSTGSGKKDDKTSSPSLEDRYELKDLLGT